MPEPSIARESLWSTLFTYIGVAIGFGTTFWVTTTYLSPEEIGLTRLLVEIATLASGVAMLGLTTSISRYFPYFRDTTPTSGERPWHNGFLYWTLRTLGLGLLITLPLIALLGEPVRSLFGQGSALLGTYYYLLLPLTAILSLWTVAELYAIQTLHLAVPKLIRELGLRVGLLVVYLAYAVGVVGQSGMVWSLVGVYGLCMVVAYGYLGRIVRLTLRHDPDYISAELRQGFRRYTTMAVLSTLGTTLALRMDLLMLAFVGHEGLKQAAVFTIGFFLVSIIEIPTRAVIGLSTARIAQAMKEEDYDRTRSIVERTSRYQLLTAMVIYLMILASVDELLGLMPRGDEYAGSASVLLVLGLAKLLEVTFTALHPVVSSSRYYHWGLYYTLWLCLIAFLANAYLIPLWGVVGASVATLTTTVVGYGLLQWVAYRRMGIHPLSGRTLGVVALGVGGWLVQGYLPSYAPPLVDIALRSSVIALLYALGVWGLSLAPEAQQALRDKLKRRSCG